MLTYLLTYLLVFLSVYIGLRNRLESLWNLVNRVKHSKHFKSKLIRLDVEMQEQSDTMLASYDVSNEI